MRIVLVANPGARRVTEETIEACYRRWSARHDVALVRSSGPGARRDLTAEHLDSEAIVVLGGDGIVNEMANAMVEQRSEAVLVPLPAGTTNVVARSIGLPNRLPDAETMAMDALDRGEVHRRGVGRLNGWVFVANAGIGLDAEIVARVESAPGRKERWGHAWFAVAAMQELRGGAGRGVRLHRLSLSSGGAGLAAESSAAQRDVFWVLAMASRPYTFVGPRPIELASARRSPSSGLLLASFSPMPVHRLVRLTAQAAITSRGIAGAKGVEFTEIHTAVRFGSSRAVMSQTDGECHQPVTDFTLSWHRDALRMLAPDSSRSGGRLQRKRARRRL